MPHIDGAAGESGKSKFITTFDLSKRYWQLALTLETKMLTVFIIPYGMCQFKVMPLVSQFAAAHLADAIIYSQT